MKKHLILLSTLVLFAFCGCNKFAGDPISKDFTIEGSYTQLEVEDAFNVIVSDEVSQITVTAGENIMPKVVVEKKEDKLVIRLKVLANSYGSEMKVVVPYNEDLTRVDLSGASEFRSEYGIYGEKVEVELSGASICYCDIEANKVQVDLSGASDLFGSILADEIDMELSGSSTIQSYIDAVDFELDLSGASDAVLEGQITNFKIGLSGASSILRKTVGTQYAFACEQCEGEMSGASDAYIHCDGSIKVNLSGACSLHYTGDASTTDSSCSGGSNIIHDVW